MEDDNGLTHPAGLSNPSSVQKPVLNRRRVMMKSNNFTSFLPVRKRNCRRGNSVTNLRQVFFCQIGQFHDGTAIDAVLQHGTGNFKGGLTLAFFNSALLTELNPLLNALLFKLLCDGHKCVSVLRYTLCQFAYKGFGVGCFACLNHRVYQRYYLR